MDPNRNGQKLPAYLSRSVSNMTFPTSPKMTLEVFLRDCVFVLLKHISDKTLPSRMDQRILDFCLRSRDNNVCEQGRLFLHGLLERKMNSLYPNSAVDKSSCENLSVINEERRFPPSVRGPTSLSDPQQQQRTILTELNTELNLVQKENKCLIEEVEDLRLGMASLKSIISIQGLSREIEAESGDPSYPHSSDETDSVIMGKGKKSRKSTPTVVSSAKGKLKEANSSTPSHDTFSIDRARCPSDDSEDGEDPTLVLWDTIKVLRDELVKVTRRQEDLIKEMISKDGELVKAEEHINGLMQELDANKVEYNAHQKVIQRLRTEESQSKEDLQKCLRSIPEQIAISQEPLNNLFLEDAKGPKSIFNLKLEQVEIKRQLARSLAEHDKLRAKHHSVLDEYGLLKEDFRVILGKSIGASPSSGLPIEQIMKQMATDDVEDLPLACIPELEFSNGNAKMANNKLNP